MALIDNNWKECKLGDITEPIKETYLPNDSDNIYYIGLEHIEPVRLRLNSVGSSKEIKSNKFLFKSNDVLFGKLRVYFRKVIKPKFDGVCSTDIWVFRAKEEIDQNFLFYFLANWDFVNLADGGEGGTRMPRADWNFLSKTKWKIPPLPEQKAIADVLSSLDDKIDLLHRQNKTLEAMAETLFRKWFVLRQAQHPEADESWEFKKLENLIDIESGKGLEKEQFIANGIYPVLGANGEIGKTNNWLFEGELIFTGRVGTLGNIFIINKNEKVWLSDNTLVIKPKNYFYFIYFILKNAKLEDYNVGSTQPLIRQTDIKEIEVQLPDHNLLNEFELMVREFFNKINLNNNQIRTLEKLRDTLLPKLISGEVRVRTVAQ